MNRRFAVGICAAGAVMILPATGSAAGAPESSTGSRTTVIAAIKAEQRIVARDPEYKQLSDLKVTTKAQAQAAIPKLRSLAVVLDHAGSVVSRASATSSQKAGQADWVDGIKEEAAAVDGLAVGLQDFVNGHTAEGKAELAKAKKRAAAAITLGEKGIRLLGVSSSS